MKKIIFSLAVLLSLSLTIGSLALESFDRLKYGSIEGNAGTLQIYPGWNFVGIPFEEGLALNEITSRCNLEGIVWEWKVDAQRYSKVSDYLEAGKGHFIYVSQDEIDGCEIPVSGTPISPSDIEIKNGWNAIAFATEEMPFEAIAGSCNLSPPYYSWVPYVGHEASFGVYIPLTYIDDFRAMYIYSMEDCRFLPLIVRRSLENNGGVIDVTLEIDVMSEIDPSETLILADVVTGGTITNADNGAGPEGDVIPEIDPDVVSWISLTGTDQTIQYTVEPTDATVTFRGKVGFVDQVVDGLIAGDELIVP
jgi:hypothetical protein